MTVTLADIQAAADRIRGHVERTPCRLSRRLSEATGAEVWVKFENLHYTSSFKERGARNALEQLSPEERARGVVTASAGNHASALARHASLLGAPCTIVMPVGTPSVKVEKSEGLGATVVIHGSGYEESVARAREIEAAEGRVFVHGFDNAAIVAGAGTCAVEMLQNAPDLDDLVVPIGGAGLIAGCAVAAKALKPGIRVVGVEAAMYPSFLARREGRTVECGGPTLAEGIAIKKIGDIPFEVADPLIDDILIVDEPDFEEAVAMFATVEKTVAEGAGAGGLAALLRHPERFAGRKVGVILCGGNIDTRLLASVLNRELVRERRLVTFRIVHDDRPGMLAAMTAAIAQAGGNIVDVVHNRLALQIPAKSTEYLIQIETRGAEHDEAIASALRSKGYALETS